VICLWGESTEYVLGALVLGHSLRRTGSPHSLVCLHTADVPQGFVRLLKLVWDCREVAHLDPAPALCFEDQQAHRFAKVFTKLRVIQLVDFEKVLLLDIDTLVLNSMDHLFELRPPAAMRRGMNESKHHGYGYKHGDELDGTHFFQGKDKRSTPIGQTSWAWGMGTGINAGAMLLQPNEAVFAQMVSEIEEPNHPSHIRSNGPEQDYLSRFWADAPWTHIGVENNFQVHQMFFALQPERTQSAERAFLLRTPERINMIHFSGSSLAKPWQRVLHEPYASYWPDRRHDEAYLQVFAGEFAGYWLWVVRDPHSWKSRSSWKGPKGRLDMDTEGMYLGSDGHIYRGSPDDEAWGKRGERVVIPEDMVQGSMTLIRNALRLWFDTYEDLERTMGFDIRQALLRAAPSEGCGQSGQGGSTDASNGGTGGGGRSGEELSLRRGRQRMPDRWWAPSKRSASVVCSSGSSKSLRFVRFVEASAPTLELDGQGFVGAFLKVVGSPSLFSCRCEHEEIDPSGQYAVDCNGETSQVDWQEAVESLQRWVVQVPEGSVVLFAAMSLSLECLRTCLVALKPLGMPAECPPQHLQTALAAILHRGIGSAASSCAASHASADVAHATH